MAYTVDTKAKFIQLRARGYSLAKISKELGISKPTLINFDKELKERVSLTAKAEEEQLAYEYRISRIGRTRALIASLDKVWQELSSRELSTVSTESLVKQAATLTTILTHDEKEAQGVITGREMLPVTVIDLGGLTKG